MTNNYITKVQVIKPGTQKKKKAAKKKVAKKKATKKSLKCEGR